MIVVIDYGSGNLRSVAKALESVGGQVRVTGDPRLLAEAARLVLPGVGAFADCRRNLEAAGLIEPVLRHLEEGRPFLGVCVGMQLLFSVSHEFGVHPGLDLLPGVVEPFAKDMTDPGDPHRHLKVPHMGWNQVQQERPHPVWAGIPDRSHFYFVHSYYCQPFEADTVVGVSEYGQTFAAAVAQDNLFATQFHPEKSQRYGLRLLENFVGWRP